MFCAFDEMTRHVRCCKRRDIAAEDAVLARFGQMADLLFQRGEDVHLGVEMGIVARPDDLLDSLARVSEDGPCPIATSPCSS